MDSQQSELYFTKHNYDDQYAIIGKSKGNNNYQVTRNFQFDKELI